MSTHKLERTTFETSRATEYFDARELQAQTGQPTRNFAAVVLKELVDNALDACETAGVAPEVSVEVEQEDGVLRLSISDNGPGIPPEVVRKVLDYSIRVSDKAAYRSPTRGAQGNALKTILGIPYALGSREPTVVVARRTAHDKAVGRRGNGEGSITRRKDGLYMARYTVETATGVKRKALYAKTRKEASERLTEALANAQKGITADAGAMTVGAFIERWLEDSVRGSVRQSTYQRDESLCRVHTVAALGKKKLKTLNAADVQRFYRVKLDSGLSSATVHKLHVLLHKALKQAERWGLVPRNVADDVDPPKVHKDEVHPLTNEQARKLLETARGDRLEALYVVALQSGLRQGELLALRWEDVDLEARTIQVRRTVTRDGGKHTVGPAKTVKGRRTVKLTRDATEALQEHLERQLTEIDKAGDKWQENGLVFCTGKGTLINPTNLRKRSFAPLLQRACLPPMTFHQLRHTAATILLLKNVNPKVVSEMLGHATIAITLDTYSHVLPNMQSSAVAAMEEAFS